jgi:hypothetical protein
LKIVTTHRGHSGDTDLEVASLDLLLETADGVALTGPQANALFSSIAVYLDDGSDVYDGADTMVAPAATPPFTLVGGRLTVTFVDGDANVEVAQGTPGECP